MAYNNYPVGYRPYYGPQPMYYQQQYQPIAQSQTAMNPSPTNSLIWVQGIEAAKSYILAPNETATLWDSEAQVIYLKSTDASGMPSMKILDYTIRDNTPSQKSIPVQNEKEYATLDDFEELKNEIARMNKKLNSMTYRKGKENRHESNISSDDE